MEHVGSGHVVIGGHVVGDGHVVGGEHVGHVGHVGCPVEGKTKLTLD